MPPGGEARSGRPGRWRLAGVVAVGLLLAVGAWWWSQGRREGPDDRVLVRLRGVLKDVGLADRAEGLARFAWPGDHVARLVAALGQEDEEALLKALAARLRSARKAGRWTLAPRHEPARGPLRSADRVAALLAEEGEKGGEAVPLCSLELAALGVAVLREAGHPAALAQLWAWKDAREPADPIGIRGVYGVAWGASLARWASPPFDEGGAAPVEGAWRVLDAAGEAAAALLVEGGRLLVHEGRPEEALLRARAAVALDGRSAPARSLLGLAQVQAGDPQAGLAAIEAARRLNQGPAPDLLSGTVALATGDLDGAARAFTRALSEAPDYAEAHALLGAVHLARGNVEEARAAVAEAKERAPELPALPMLEAELALRDGDVQQAVRHARDAVARRAKQWEVHLQAGRIYRLAADYDAMRRAARSALELAPAPRRDMVRQLALRLLGPTAFDETSEEVLAEAEDAEEVEEGGDLLLPDPSRIGSLRLGEAGSGGAGGLPAASGLQLDAPEPKLRLRGPDEDLRLQLRP